MIGTVTTWVPLEPGIIGTTQTLDLMRSNVTACVLDPHQLTRACCAAILEQAGALAANKPECAQAIFDWIHNNVVFRRDAYNVERPVSPLLLLSQAEEFQASGGKSTRPIADCKSQASLCAALGFSVGLPMCWVVIGPSPDEFSHVYACLELVPGNTDDSSLLALDTATTMPTFGLHSTEVSRWVVPAINDF